MWTATAYLVGITLGYIAGKLIERKKWLTELESLINWAEEKIEEHKDEH